MRLICEKSLKRYNFWNADVWYVALMFLNDDCTLIQAYCNGLHQRCYYAGNYPSHPPFLSSNLKLRTMERRKVRWISGAFVCIPIFKVIIHWSQQGAISDDCSIRFPNNLSSFVQAIPIPYVSIRSCWLNSCFMNSLCLRSPFLIHNGLWTPSENFLPWHSCPGCGRQYGSW